MFLHGRRFLLLLVLVVAAAALAASAAADDSIAVFSFAGQDRFVEDLQTLSQLSNSEALDDQIVAWLSRISGLKSLRGMSTDRPLGAVIQTDGLVVSMLAFFPVDNAEELIKSLEAGQTTEGTPAGTVTRLSADRWKIEAGKLSGFIRVRSGWLYFSQSADALDAPPDPIAVLGELPTRYDAALQLNLQKIPDVFRQFLIDLVRKVLQDDSTTRDGESAAAHHLRYSWLRFEFDLFERVISESEAVTVGLNLDSQTRQAAFDVKFRPLQGTSLTTMLKNLRNADTRFDTLLEDGATDGAENEATVVGHATLAMEAGQIERTVERLKDLRAPVLEVINNSSVISAPADREMLAHLVGTLFDTAAATVSTGRLDMAILGRGEKAPITVLAAAHVGTSENLRKLLERIAESSAEGSRLRLERNVTTITLEPADPAQPAAEKTEIPVHTLAFDTANSQILSRLFGDDTRLYLALGDEVAWMGIGPGALAGLQRVAARERQHTSQLPSQESGMQIVTGAHDIEVPPPISLELRLGEIAAVAAQASDSFLWRLWMGSIANGLRTGGDRLTFRIEADPAELHARLEMEEGVLRAVAAAIALNLAAEPVASESTGK